MANAFQLSLNRDQAPSVKDGIPLKKDHVGWLIQLPELRGHKAQKFKVRIDGDAQLSIKERRIDNVYLKVNGVNFMRKHSTVTATVPLEGAGNSSVLFVGKHLQEIQLTISGGSPNLRFPGIVILHDKDSVIFIHELMEYKLSYCKEKGLSLERFTGGINMDLRKTLNKKDRIKRSMRIREES